MELVLTEIEKHEAAEGKEREGAPTCNPLTHMHRCEIHILSMAELMNLLVDESGRCLMSLFVVKGSVLATESTRMTRMRWSRTLKWTLAKTCGSTYE